MADEGEESDKPRRPDPEAPSKDEKVRVPKYNQHLRDQVNRDGYAFQQAIAHVIDATKSTNHRWDVLEWEGPSAGGFVDIVAHRAQMMCVIECKRLLKANWVFPIVEKMSESTVRYCRAYYSKPSPAPPPTMPYLIAADFETTHGSHLADQCSWKGEEERGTHSLEPICRQLLGYARHAGETIARPLDRDIYVVPVIVTTAKLHVAVYDRAKVSLKDGNLPDKTDWKKVDVVRFHKAFTDGQEVRNSEKYSLSTERPFMQRRTVFICQGEAFEKFLRELWLDFPAPRMIPR